MYKPKYLLGICIFVVLVRQLLRLNSFSKSIGNGHKLSLSLQYISMSCTQSFSLISYFNLAITQFFIGERVSGRCIHVNAYQCVICIYTYFIYLTYINLVSNQTSLFYPSYLCNQYRFHLFGFQLTEPTFALRLGYTVAQSGHLPISIKIGKNQVSV